MRNKSIGALTLVMFALLGVTLLTRNSQVQASHALQEASAKTNADKLPEETAFPAITNPSRPWQLGWRASEASGSMTRSRSNS